MRHMVFGFALLITVMISIDARSQSGAEVYAAYCSGCHGPKMEGSAATALIKTDWKHGSDRSSIVKSIRDGIPGTEMMKWGEILSTKDIDAVADYIMKAQKSPSTVTVVEKPLSVNTKDYKLKIEKVITAGLKGPWGIEFVDAGHALITGKFGDVYWMVSNKLDPQRIEGVPRPYGYDMFGGMMDLALDPDYAKNGWVYIGFSHNPQGSTEKATPGMTKIVRGKIKDHRWVEEQTLFKVSDSLLVKGGTRWGCRLLIDNGGYLYFTIGDMNRADDAQMLTRPSGKVYRINRDGTIPNDNPLVGRPELLQAIFSWGNRNVQGMAQHPVTGLIYGTEHGPQGGDELNILKSGANYGWPLITYGIDYDGSTITEETHREGMEQPLTYWTPSIAVSAIDFVTSPRFPKWKNNLIVGALKFEEVRRLVIDGDRVLDQEILLKGYGRVRDVKFGPDGALYLLMNTPDALLRVVPE